MQNRPQLTLWLGRGQVRFFSAPLLPLNLRPVIDHLLSLRDSDSIPFTREECRDLMTLLQSLIGQFVYKSFGFERRVK